MTLLTFYPSRYGSKATLFDGMITVEIMPEYGNKDINVYGKYMIGIGLNYWSRDKWHEGDKRWYYPATPEGLKAAEEAAEKVLRKMVGMMWERMGKG